jgi:hypothetical protein
MVCVIYITFYICWNEALKTCDNILFWYVLVRRFRRYANNASLKSTKSNRSISKENDLSDGFKEVMYKV